MPYDEGAAERVRTVPAGHAGVSEQRMFGGLAFLWNGNVACGVLDYELVVRVAPDAYDDAFEWGHARLTGGRISSIDERRKVQCAGHLPAARSFVASSSG